MASVSASPPTPDQVLVVLPEPGSCVPAPVLTTVVSGLENATGSGHFPQPQPASPCLKLPLQKTNLTKPLPHSNPPAALRLQEKGELLGLAKRLIIPRCWAPADGQVSCPFLKVPYGLPSLHLDPRLVLLPRLPRAFPLP